MTNKAANIEATRWSTNPRRSASEHAESAQQLTAETANHLGGFLIGWGARRALRMTALVAGIAILLLGLPAKFGLDGSAIELWLQASVGWVGEHLDMAQRYLASLLPSATAAGAGSVMGYRRKRR